MHLLVFLQKVNGWAFNYPASLSSPNSKGGGILRNRWPESIGMGGRNGPEYAGYMGLMVGGPLGPVAGAALGHHLVDKQAGQTGGRLTFMRAEQTQAAYFVSMFSILGKLAKIDGVVTKAEIAVVEDFINQLNMTETEKKWFYQFQLTIFKISLSKNINFLMAFSSKCVYSVNYESYQDNPRKK